jgi:acylphosphatase
MAKHISVTGVVQGIGFRPFVYGLATRLGLHGWVCNTSAGVEIVVAGQDCHIEEFIHSLTLEKPPLAKIDSIQVEETFCDLPLNFEIRESQEVDGMYQPISLTLPFVPIANASCSIQRISVIFIRSLTVLTAGLVLRSSRISRMIVPTRPWQIFPCAIAVVRNTQIR